MLLEQVFAILVLLREPAIDSDNASFNFKN